ncbi:hypothetical protein CFN17_02640 [Arthrobacter sp. PM3]|nr:hypothetical protein CFN17_02640 [Arthrobacter sp. PM3]
MATQSRSLRRGLPRVPGGEPWPPAGEAPARFVSAPVAAPAAAAAVPQETAADTTAVSPPAAAAKVPAATVAAVDAPTLNASAPNAAAAPRQLRRGLPRVPGGEPWPPAGTAPVSVAARTGAPAATAMPTAAVPDSLVPAGPAGTAAPEVAPSAVAPVAASATPAVPASGATALRRGLPRVPGGEPWPPAGLAPVRAAAPGPEPAVQAEPEPAVQAGPEPAVQEIVPVASAAETVTAVEPSVPLPPAAPAPAASPVAEPYATQEPAMPKAEAKLYGSRTLGQWIKLVVLIAAGSVAAAGILVLAARGVTTLPGVPEFLSRYPGVYDLPAAAEPGFPWWAQWAHFFNFFLMALIIRSGYQVRTQQKPPAYWTPKRGGKKISINLWLHQCLDILWLVNGLIFVVLLLASGRWMRLVPTSWEVFPNALSALLQYMTLDWPVESGWTNYNSLQQLMYFIVVFIAAPLAAITGVRMSEFWPKNAKTLSRIYPVEVARAIHFPTMLFFVLFILVHVFLVFATGALRNLNHMFGGSDEVNWTGFWLFAAAIAVTAAAWYAARPIVLAPIAKLFGQVSSR